MKYILALCICTLITCNYDSPKIEKNILIKPIDGTGVFNDYFYIKKIVPLETNNKCLIGTLSFVKETKSGNILIISNMHKSSVEVFIYNEKGDFLYKIGKRGQGPGEYNSIIDICLDENDYVYILDSKKIHVYSNKGIFNKSIPVNFYSSGIFVTKKNIYFSKEHNANEDDFSILLKVKKSGELCGEYIKNDYLLNFKTVYRPKHPYDMNINNVALLSFYRKQFKKFSKNDNKIISYIFTEDNCDDNKSVRNFMKNNLKNVVPRKKREEVFKKLHRFDSVFLFDNNNALLVTNFNCYKKGELLLLDLITNKCIDTGISMWDIKDEAPKYNLLPYKGFGVNGKFSKGFIVISEDFKFLETNRKKLGISDEIHFSPNSNPVLCFVAIKESINNE